MVCSLFSFLFMVVSANSFIFQTNYVDLNYGGNGRPGWVRSGDMDGDGDRDIVAGGGYALFIYANDGNAGSWKRYGNLDSTGNMGANGAVLFDVDRDGDLDVVSAKYYDDIGWWENPGGDLGNGKWQFRAVFKSKWFLHDLLCVDLNNDGKAEEFLANLNSKYWNTEIEIIWFRITKWEKGVVEAGVVEPGRNEGDLHCHAGLDVGDVDRDGLLDVAFSNGWYKAAVSEGARWVWHPVADVYGISNCLLSDMDLDGDLDLVLSAGHHGKGIYWYRNPSDPVNGKWRRHIVDDSIHHPEGLAVVDLNGDTHLDIIACELDFDRWEQEVHNVYILENKKNSISWLKHNIAPNSFPSHQIQVVDMNEDGKPDIVSEGAGYGVVSYFENHSKYFVKKGTLD